MKNQKIKSYMICSFNLCNWCKEPIKAKSYFIYYDNFFYCCNDCMKKYIRHFKNMEKKYKDIL